MRWLGSYDRLLTTVLCLAIFLTCSLSPIQSDTWWQLRAGHDMFASRQVLLTDTYSHTASGAFWSNHEWLAEVVFYALYSIGGLGLLTIFSAGLIAAGWMVSWSMRRGPARPAFILFLCALVSSSGWWEPRPHAFSLLFIPMTVFLVERNRVHLAAAGLPDMGAVSRRRPAGARAAHRWPGSPPVGRPQFVEGLSRRFRGLRPGHDGDAARHPFLDGDSAISFEDQPVHTR